MTYESNRISERNATYRALLIEIQAYRMQGRGKSFIALLEAEATAYRAKTLDLVKAYGVEDVFA